MIILLLDTNLLEKSILSISSYIAPNLASELLAIGQYIAEKGTYIRSGTELPFGPAILIFCFFKFAIRAFF